MKLYEAFAEYEKGIMAIVADAGNDKIMASITAGMPMILFDSGAFRHIWGTDLVHSGLVYNIVDLENPSNVGTACGDVTLYQEGTITLRDIEFTGAINKHMKISLISEGLLFVNGKWDIGGSDGIKSIKPPPSLGVDPFTAEMCGNLAFWPQVDVARAINSVVSEWVTQFLYTRRDCDSGWHVNER